MLLRDGNNLIRSVHVADHGVSQKPLYSYCISAHRERLPFTESDATGEVRTGRDSCWFLPAPSLTLNPLSVKCLHTVQALLIGNDSELRRALQNITSFSNGAECDGQCSLRTRKRASCSSTITSRDMYLYLARKFLCFARCPHSRRTGYTDNV